MVRSEVTSRHAIDLVAQKLVIYLNAPGDILTANPFDSLFCGRPGGPLGFFAGACSFLLPTAQWLPRAPRTLFPSARVITDWCRA